MSRDQSPLLPAKFHVVWRARRCAGLPSDGYPASYTSTVNLSDLSPTDSVVPSVLSGTAGVTRTVRSFGPALYSSPSGDPSNLNNLKNLATQYAQDWFDWATADQPGDIVVSGVVAPAPNGLIDCVEWAYAEGQCFTRISSPPLNGAPDQLAHMDPAISGCVDATNATTTNYTPSILMDVPGATIGGAVTNASAWSLITLEDGQLASTYLGTKDLSSCSCSAPATPPCGYVDVRVFGCVQEAPGATVTVQSIVGTIPLGTGAITIDNGGSPDFFAVPSITFIPHSVGTTTAVGTAILSGGTTGTLTAINVTYGGIYNATPPTISISPATRNAAAHVNSNFSVTITTVGTCVTKAGAIITCDLNGFGNGYTSAPTVTFSGGGGGSGAAATAILDPLGSTTISALLLTNTGSGYSSAPIVNFTPPPAGSGHVAPTATTTIGAGCLVPLTATGFYQAKSSPPPTWVNFAETAYQQFSYTCGKSNAEITSTILSATGYLSGCCFTNSLNCFSPPVALPKTLTLSDGLGNVTMTSNGNQGLWNGCGIRTATQAFGPVNSCGTQSNNTPVPVFFTFSCNTNGTFFVSALVPICRSSNVNVGLQSGVTCSTGIGALGFGTNAVAPSSCTPFLWSAPNVTPLTSTGATPNFCDKIYSSNPTLTVTA